MAEFLVYAKNEDDPSWDADTKAMRQQRGHIVDVGKNGKNWGRSESLSKHLLNGGTTTDWHGKFVIIKVPSLSVVKARKLLGPAHRPRVAGDPEFELVLPGAQPLRPVKLKKFQWRINFRKLPIAARNELRDTGELKLTLAQLRVLADHNVTRHRFDENAHDGKGAVRTAAEQADPDEVG